MLICSVCDTQLIFSLKSNCFWHLFIIVIVVFTTFIGRSLFVSKLVLSCMLAFLQVMKTFCDGFYWQVQQGMQLLHLHCWAIWCCFGLRFFLSAVLVIVSISPFMKSPRCKNNWSGVCCRIMRGDNGRYSIIEYIEWVTIANTISHVQ